MFAVVKTGGKQYKVAENDVIRVEKLAGEAGSTIELTDVLMAHDGKELKVGNPLLSGTVVTAEILEQTRTDKITIFKKKRRQNYRRKRGHRQPLTVLKVTGIGAAKKTAAKKPAAKAADAPAKDAATEAKAPAKKPAAKKTTTKAASTKTAATKAPAKKAPAKKPAAKKTKTETKE